MKHIVILIIAISFGFNSFGQELGEGRRFEQLGTLLPTPNTYRTASGAPGNEYWQQRADYAIKVELNDDNQTIQGSEVITYFNYSPNPLHYFWLQLEQNMRNVHSDTYSTQTSSMQENITEKELSGILGHQFDLGFKISEVTTSTGESLPYTINKTMMRVDLPKAVLPGASFSFVVKWMYNINDRKKVGGRSGMEYFAEDGNYLYSIAQFFPRMAVYNDVDGWQHKQFLGRGEFTLPFGNYDVEITVPADHIVAATGVLQNTEEVLTKKQITLFEKAKTSDTPVIIVPQSEVVKKEKSKSPFKKTWIYHADSVRDFAFASSRKLIWDAMGVQIGDNHIMAMSYYPKEANPLYEKYSTKVVAHTLKAYSKYTINYPYPVAISVEASNGMEYPMICFNYGRPDPDGTYTNQVKYGMISVITHEVGHNFFPMIINSDERQWTWMDEGLNTFVQYLAEQEWEEDYPSRRGPPEKIVPYMKGSSSEMVPIMTNSEQVKQFGNNAYSKPATALNILRNTIMGPELFDYAFKEYCERWQFKHPTPADFFRTMEDASAVDLDWFWKGWFYTTDNVEMEIADVTWYKYVENDHLLASNKDKRKKKNGNDKQHSEIGNGGYNTDIELVPEEKLQNYRRITTDLIETTKLLDASKNFYEIKIKNNGGLVMPVILQFNYRDNTSEIQRIPAEIWRKDEKEITKVFVLEKELESVVLDPLKETADVNESNNYFPPKNLPSKFELFKNKKE